MFDSVFFIVFPNIYDDSFFDFVKKLILKASSFFSSDVFFTTKFFDGFYKKLFGLIFQQIKGK